ncbi:hypothetical protein DAPK24_024720 [Pichia kluyveri]|uniref:Phage protein n=1 Tax=Pichia kluyveri TaxID=36015 RepID=A0AAV5R4F1_PICKL|nr:hypothetical protein DAPK24_024720 [Pichia kluyveri]
MGFEEIEYREIYQNYTEFDHLKPLLLSIKHKEECLEIEWIENIIDKIYVCEDGWYANEFQNSQKFPTFESLAMRRSKIFNKKWAETLYMKLQELDEE